MKKVGEAEKSKAVRCTVLQVVSMLRTQLYLLYEKRELQVALRCRVDTHSGINIARFVAIGKIFY